MDIEKAIELYQQGYSQHYLQNVCEDRIDSKILRAELIKRGIPIRPNRKHEFNENYFDVIDSEEKAYWLGFIYADGHNGSTFELSLKEADLGHLIKFANAIGLNSKPSYRPKQKAYRITFRRKHFQERLTELGVTKNKTYECLFPTFLPSNLMNHFIRGYFDGDGSISYNATRCGSSKLRLDLIGTEPFLRTLIKEARLDCDLKLDNRWKESSPTRRIYLHHEKALKFLDYMYKDCSIYLDRKYQLYIAASSGNI